MAKASAQITLHHVVDIQGIYRYYLLQGSTLAKPSKPTSYPPKESDLVPAFTNLADPTKSDWYDKYRLNSSGVIAPLDGYTVTNFYEFEDGDILRIKNAGNLKPSADTSNIKICNYDSTIENKTALFVGFAGNKFSTQQTLSCFNEQIVYEDGAYKYTLFARGDGSMLPNPGPYFRLSLPVSGDNAKDIIITLNEEIKYVPATASWSDTEPTYQNGATNSLYFVDCTVFSDGTYEYSEVSLSTAYEAAKEAWNKAQNAQDSADSAQGAIEDLENEVTDSLDKVTSDLTSFTTTTNTKFEAIDERFRITAEGYETKLQNTGDGLQAQITEIMKHFDFTADGMVIGQKDNPFKTTIDNDRYEMSSNGMAVVWIEGGVFFVPEIIVTSRFKMLGYDIKETPVTINGTTIMRTDWDYIGGE